MLRLVRPKCYQRRHHVRTLNNLTVLLDKLDPTNKYDRREVKVIYS